MITTLFGSNSFALQRRLDELIRNFVVEHGKLALERFDAQEADFQVIFEAVSNLPFLATRKMVVLRNPSSNKELTDKIEQIISSTAETTQLILNDPTIDRRTVYFKVLKGQTQLEEFKDLDNHALAKWLVEEAKKGGGEISFSDANYLVERLGSNQSLLDSELQKLLIYEPKIARANIDLLTLANPQSKVFELLDAAFSGQKKKALQLYDEQKAQKVEAPAILAMIAWQLQLIALAKQGRDRSANQIADDSGMKEYPVRKAQSMASSLDEAKINQMIETALEIDYRGKTSSFDMDEALKTYIVTL